jgi:hypothetical protein
LPLALLPSATLFCSTSEHAGSLWLAAESLLLNTIKNFLISSKGCTGRPRALTHNTHSLLKCAERREGHRKPSAKNKEGRRKAESRNRALYKALCVY